MLLLQPCDKGWIAVRNFHHDDALANLTNKSWFEVFFKIKLNSTDL